MPRCLSSTWVALLGLLVAGAAGAQEARVEVASAGAPRFYRASDAAPVLLDVRGTPQLTQRISVDLDGVTLRQALHEISHQAGLPLMYSKEDLPLDQPVRLRAEHITVAGALSEVLMDAGIDVVLSPDGRAALVRRTPAVWTALGRIVGRVTDAKTQAALAGATVVVEGARHGATTGNDGRYRITEVAPGTYTVRARYIGYAPATVSVTVSPDQEATADLALGKSAQRLDEVVTTGTMVPTEVKALPTPISVVTGDEIEQKGYQRLDQIFRGDVPGAVAWDRSSIDFGLSQVAVRGASNLTSTPSIKTFIDGVEVADPLYLAAIDPTNVDRIEITRGPQASTLYGAGALSGVMQIFTKKGEIGLRRPEVTATVSAGGIGGFMGQSTALQTEDALSVVGGGEKTTYSLSGSYGRTGDWVPDYGLTHWAVSAGGKTSQGPLALTGSARYVDKTLDYPWALQLRSYTPFSQPPYETDRLRLQTYGLTASLQATRTWQHTLTLGYDQSYYNWYNTQPRFTTPADSFLSVFQAHEAMTSLLYHTDLGLRLGHAIEALVTVGVNHTAYDFGNAYTSGATRTTGSVDGFTFPLYTAYRTTGYFGQVQLNIAEQLFLTGGLRAERNDNFGAGFGTAWSPRTGLAYALALGPATVKLRASYGESIRAPDPGERDAITTTYQLQLANPALAPERQRGVDGGIDVNLGRMSLGVTYYNQRATDLISNVAIPEPSGMLPTYQYQNLSRVKNDGWEFEGRLPLGRIQLAGTYSITNSTILTLPPGYPAGGYQVGDRVNGIPHTSAGATITYSPYQRTTLSASMTNIGQWTQVDFISYYAFAYGGQPYRGSTRAYWMEYPAVTKFALAVSQEVRQGFTAFARVENLGNTLRYEAANLIVPKPRSVVVGGKLRY